MDLICPTCGLAKSKAGHHRNGAQRYRCSPCARGAGRRSVDVALSVPIEVTAPVYTSDAPAPTKKRIVIAYAQNATPAHRGFLSSIKWFCEEKDAELLVIPGRYVNPTSIWSREMQSNETWDEALRPFLCRSRVQPMPGVSIFGDISIQPTAERPLSRMEVFAGEGSAIFGHPRVQLMTVATATRSARILASTGAITIPNYTDSRAGKTADGHHTLGAIVLELDGDTYHIRHVTADESGSFSDLDRRYTPSGSSAAPRAAAIVLGDLHVGTIGDAVQAATFDGDGSMFRRLRPETAVYHDVLDFDVRNHHTIGNFLDRHKRATGGAPDSVEQEVFAAIDFVDKHTPADCAAYVVASNHHDAFDRWLNTADPRHDPVNAEFFHRTWSELIASRRAGSNVSAFELIASGRSKRVKFVGRNGRLRIAGVDCGFHGDMGTDGARGSPQTYARLGCATVIGHSHSPKILDSCYQVGVTGDLDQGYNTLPSSWLHTHCVIYADGNRALLNVINGKWCL